MRILPSLLAAPTLKLYNAVEDLMLEGFDCFHIDMMDYHYTQNFGISLKACEELLYHFPTITLDVHLMTNPTPLHLIETLKDMGIKEISVHPNTLNPISTDLRLALSPNEDINTTYRKLLFLTVNPGFSHQKMQIGILEKAKIAKERGCNITIDGGVNLETLDAVLDIKPDNVIIGGALFGKDREKLLVRLKDLLDSEPLS
jgi:ribulose-phosphate 3-epimerase